MSKNTKEVQRRADAKRVGRTRNFATIVYPESAPENWQNLIAESKLQAFISPLHDSDINPDGTHKKPHYHVIICFDTVKTLDQAKVFTQKIGGIGIEKVSTLRGYARYLCHLDNPEKAQYSLNLVKCFGGADYQEVIALPSDKYKILGEMIDYCTDNHVISYAELVRYARANRQDWFRCLADSGTFMMKEYLKSVFWEISQ